MLNILWQQNFLLRLASSPKNPTSVDFLQTARNTVAELNSRGDSLARERRRFVTYQAEPHEVSTATGFSWQTEDGHADWPGDLAGNGAGKDETGSVKGFTRSLRVPGDPFPSRGSSDGFMTENTRDKTALEHTRKNTTAQKLCGK
ncbi:hypothetical protein K0M31_003382 [Melipona bicolor]|uniref:Uncharacterized protein n=1 Tax=Melipona bicolor TaxID=60889 RepID=A0AA40FYW8_9HYME|nr:hypothetical protein K0M31_003382 [Melipona bicolor]